MREDSRVTFVKKSGGAYNPRTHQFEPETYKKWSKSCHMNDLGVDESIRIFGNYKDDRKVVRFGQPIREDFDYILFNGLQYKALHHRLFRTVFYIEADSVTDGELS